MCQALPSWEASTESGYKSVTGTPTDIDSDRSVTDPPTDSDQGANNSFLPFLRSLDPSLLLPPLCSFNGLGCPNTHVHSSDPLYQALDHASPQVARIN